MGVHIIGTGEAAKILRIHRTTLIDWVHQGLITPLGKTKGGHYRWSKKKVEVHSRRMYGHSFE